jgi:hypothetical protein
MGFSVGSGLLYQFAIGIRRSTVHFFIGDYNRVWKDGDIHKGRYHGQGLHVSTGRDLVVAFFGTAEAQGPWNEMPSIARTLSASFGT